MVHDREERDLERELRDWLAGWGREVAGEDFAAASKRFASDVIGYGTKATVARGLDALRAEQWRAVWPNIDGFAFDSDGADVWVAGDGLMGIIAARWDSLGRRADGSSFPRGGRATVVLQRANRDDPWLGRHTHFSLEPVDPGTHVDG
ncbi:MAG: nuclear transport factor 2 family protein [Acidimicrobiia bacterium]|nr:nuclear transport factor 2 family protein [Acidimicrobiia bacterium]